MKIGIVGSGPIGSGLAERLVRAGHHVWITNSSGGERLETIAASVGAKPASAADAIADADAVVFAIPFGLAASFDASALATRAEGAPILDATNYFPQFRDDRVPSIEAGQPDSAWIAAQLGHPVVKAFNAIKAELIIGGSRAAGAGDRIALPIAGDSAQGKAVTCVLLDDVGFDTVDAGSLEDSWRIQPGTPAFLAHVGTDRLKTAISLADRSQIAEYIGARPEDLAKLNEQRRQLLVSADNG